MVAVTQMSVEDTLIILTQRISIDDRGLISSAVTDLSENPILNLQP